MNVYQDQAILFDLDDTLLDRDRAVDQLFLVLLEKCYGQVQPTDKNEMLKKFKEYDNRSYGESDKTNVIAPFFDEFPPKFRLPSSMIQAFWNNHFPLCFSIDQNTINIVNAIKKQFKLAIITNGSTQRQKAKIMNTHLNNCFDTIIISEEVGYRKPDKRIFELALHKIHVQPENALFVGDNIEIDIGGSQSVGMRGIWFNPHKIKNATDIKPYAEITSLTSLLKYIQD